MMKRKTFTLLSIITTAAIGYVMGWSINSGSPFIPVVAVAAGTVFICLLKRRVNEVIEDERIWRINEKASGFTLRVFLPLTAVIGIVLVSLSKGGVYSFEKEGYILLYCTYALLVLFLVSYIYYGRRGDVQR
jgi:uncharacterized membrane protein